mmetsp:Transcript_2426/g.7517  ORF Transcript_2426/g.7517 Transcript_2426/m.7517 type:complete len:478 (-) Transcript_2426:190-1623(-)
MGRGGLARLAAVGCVVVGFRQEGGLVARGRGAGVARKAGGAEEWDASRAVEQLVEVRKDGTRQRLFETRRVVGRKRRRLLGATKAAFLPEAVTSAYYGYSMWRCLQRLLSATVNVFGLQAMIMAVGVRDASSGKAIGAAAAIDWVLKDALGKVTRLIWAGRMGREFDADAKRWRFRSSLLYATGNGLQIATFAAPHLFLLLATVANSLKQISLLTSTATRSAIYRSFALTEATNNIGDITAKGEAQIAVVDLLGMALGISLSRACGFGRDQLIALYAGLSFLEICAMYREIRCVVFRQLNLERASEVLAAFVANRDATRDADRRLPTPDDAASREHILFAPTRSDKDTFPPLADLKKRLDPAALAELIDVFQHQQFLLAPLDHRRFGIVLKPDATDPDILQALLALHLAEHDRDGDDLARLRRATRAAEADHGALLDALHAAGWSTSSFMFPSVRARLDWPAPSQEPPGRAERAPAR